MDEQSKGEVYFPCFDECTRITNCVIEILRNSETGEISVGWYRTDDSEEFEI